MKRVSIDNGNTYITPDQAVAACDDPHHPCTWDAMVQMMDDDAREAAHMAVAPCDEATYLREYLRRAPCDLIIG